MSLARRVGHVLRSRKIAVALIFVTGVSAAIGTIPGNEGWFGRPFFVVPLVWLTMSTVACSWERTSLARRLAADPGAVTEALATRLRERPDYTIDAGGLSLADGAEVLRSEGLKVRSGSTLVAGWAGRAGLLGSPLFHWSLVGLFLAIVLGQATMSTGLIGVPVGGSAAETGASYGKLKTGPLFIGHSGLTIAVDDWRRVLLIDGIDRGPVPTVSVSRDGRVLARQQVYANRPLRYGPMLIHLNEWGLAARLSIESSAGAGLEEFPVLVDFADEARSRTASSSVDYRDVSGRPWRVTTRLVPAEGDAPVADTAASADAMISAGEPGGRPTVEGRLSAGDRLTLPDGNTLAYIGAAPYARLSVVRDWSVLPIYFLLFSATVGLALALLVPYRAVWLLLAEKDGTPVLNIVYRHIRRDRIFVEQIIESLDRLRNEKGGSA